MRQSKHKDMPMSWHLRASTGCILRVVVIEQACQPVQAAPVQMDKCVVIGLQSTGDARTVEAVAERAVDGELDDFVSGPKVSDLMPVTKPVKLQRLRSVRTSAGKHVQLSPT